jgi:hypothetical protein
MYDVKNNRKARSRSEISRYYYNHRMRGEKRIIPSRKAESGRQYYSISGFANPGAVLSR